MHRALHRHTGKTKGRVARRIPIHPNLLPLFEAMHAEVGGKGNVLALADELHLALVLRRHLKAANAGRSSLLKAEATARRLTFHDLRGTGITWHAVIGTEPLRIQQWAGHVDFATTQSYLVTADAVGREGFGTPFPVLPECLFSGTLFWRVTSRSRNVVDAKGLEPLTPAV